MKNLQQAADDVGVIAETVEALGKLLDRFHREHGAELYEHIVEAWPDASNFGGSAPKPLYDLEHQWSPPEYEGV